MPSLPDEVVETTNEIRNEYDFRGGILTALGQEYTASDVRDKETFRQKLLTGLSQEYTQDDIKQTDLFRDKVVTGLSGLASGGGGGDFSTAEVTIHATYGSVSVASQTQLCAYSSLDGLYYIYDMNSDSLMDGQTYTVLLHQGETSAILLAQIGNVTTSGNVTAVASGSRATRVTITGDCTITIS